MVYGQAGQAPSSAGVFKAPGSGLLSAPRPPTQGGPSEYGRLKTPRDSGDMYPQAPPRSAANPVRTERMVPKTAPTSHGGRANTAHAQGMRRHTGVGRSRDTMTAGSMMRSVETRGSQGTANFLAYHEPKSGDLDIWPASEAAALNDIDSTKPRPRFLRQLEQFVETEMRLLDCPTEGPSELRLQVFREAFQFFINEFRTYKPFLSAVKTEYENIIEHIKAQGESIAPLRAKLATVKKETNLIVSGVEEEHRKEVLGLRKIIEEQRHEAQIGTENEEKLNDEISKLKGRLDKVSKRASELEDSNLNLTKAMAHFQKVLAESERGATDGQMKAEELRQRLEAVKQEYSAALIESVNENNLLKQKAAVAIAPQEYEKLLSENEFLKRQLQQGREQHKKLQADLKATEASIQEMTHLDADLLGRLTPRPEWKKAKALFAGMPTASMTTGDKVDYLMEEVTRNKEENSLLKRLMPEHLLPNLGDSNSGGPTSDKYFQALGSDPKVPKFLRFSGRIRNRMISKRELEILIKDIWAKKSALDKGKKNAVPLAECFFMYLQKRFGIQSMIAEWGYNIVDALKRYQSDADCELFLKVLSGELSEETRVDQMEVIEGLFKAMKRMDKICNNQGKVMGYLTRPDMNKCLRQVFHSKTEERLAYLRLALVRQVPGEKIEYMKLLEEDSEGNQGVFIEAVRDQYLAESEEFLKEIEMLAKLKMEMKGGVIDQETAFDVFNEVDPKAPLKVKDDMLKRCFPVTEKKKGVVDENTEQLSIKELMTRLRQGLVKRYTKKRNDGEDFDTGGYLGYVSD